MGDRFAPDGRWWRAWARTGAIVCSGARTAARPLWLPVRGWYVVWDRLAFAWWWYGYGLEGMGHFRTYRRLEEGFAAVYWWLYSRLVVIIQRGIGD